MPIARLIALSLATLCACGTSAGIPAADGGEANLADAGTIGCELDSRADVFAANLQKPGQSAAIQFTLLSSDPSPPARGTNTWTLKLTDAMGQPIEGATLTVEPFMPDHGHGTSVLPKASSSGNTYTVKSLYLFMPGLWRIALSAKTSTVSDTTTFTFCIAG